MMTQSLSASMDLQKVCAMLITMTYCHPWQKGPVAGRDYNWTVSENLNFDIHIISKAVVVLDGVWSSMEPTLKLFTCM